MNKLNMTKHFIERYCERVLLTDNLKSELEILKDMDIRMTTFEKNALNLLLLNQGTIKIPMSATFRLIIKDSSLITIY